MLWPFFFTVLLFAGALFGLWRVNLPRPQRHRQLWSPVTAILLSIGLLYVLQRVGTPAHQEWTRLVAQADALLARTGIGGGGALLPLGVNLGILVAYLAAKLVGNGLARVGNRWLGAFGVAPAYRDHPEQGVVLRHDWVYPGLLFRRAGWAVGGGLLLLAIFAALIEPLAFALPQLPALAVLLLLEAGWYLGGLLPVERVGRVTGQDVDPHPAGDYTELWEEYQRVWPEHLLAASASAQLAPAPTPSTVAPRAPHAGDEVQQAVTRVWHDLVAAGHPLGDAHYQILEQLWRGRDVLLSDADYGTVAPVLFAFLHRVLVDGHTVLVLVPSGRRADPDACARVGEWLREGLHAVDEGGAIWTTCRFDEFQQLNQHPDLLVAAPEELLGRGVTNEAWFSRLRVVVFLEGTQTVFEAPMRTDALMRVLSRRAALQQVFLAGDREGLESAMRDNLALVPREYRPPRPAPPGAFAIVWSLEPLSLHPGLGRFQDRVMIGPVGGDLGAEAVLALPAWRDGVSPVFLVDQEGLPWAEYVEELENHRSNLMEPVLASRLSGSAHEVVRVPSVPQLLPRRERAFILARDRDCNLVAALRAWLPFGSQSVFVHVVSPPYLLRDYLAANLEYFIQAPLLALSPRLAESRLVVAYSCLERLTTGPLAEHEVLSELRAVFPNARYVDDTLTALFREALGIDPVELNLLSIEREHRFDEARHAFEEVVTYRLSPEIKEFQALQWLRRYRILDRGAHELGGISFDHLYQTYLPGQVHAFQGKPFKMEWVDHASAIVWVDHESPDGHPTYRPARRVILDAVYPSELLADRRLRIEGGWDVEAALCRSTFRVRTPGYYTFVRDIALTEEGFAFDELDVEQVPERAYQDGRLLRLRITPPDPDRLDARTRDRVADTLAVLFQEAFRTLYPETFTFLLACAPGSAERWLGDPVQALVPLMGPEPAPTDGPPAPSADGKPGRKPKGDPLVLYFFEDSHAPLGLARSLFDERNNVLALLEDYLSWVLEDEEHTEPTWRRPDAARDRFLRYGMDAPLPVLDLAQAHAFLRGLLQGNPRRAERRSFLRGDRRPVAAADPTRQCDFCSRVLAAAEFDQLEDGRQRCAQCRETAVDTVHELKKVYEEARHFLVHELGEKIRKDVEVEFADVARVQEAAGRPFMPTAELDGRATGVTRLQDGRFFIVIENGQPYHRTLGTMVHELTHIWQHTYLDFERMKNEHGLLLIEGLAQWTELTCLRRKGLAPAYVAQEESRTDIYGHGYRMILEWQRQYANLGDPFDILRNLYPALKKR